MQKLGITFLLLFLSAGIFCQNLSLKEKKKKWGYVNSKKKFVIDPVYDHAERFRNESAIVKKGEDYNLINKKGENLLTENYDTLRRSGSYIIYRLDSKYGILDSMGVEVSKPIFEKIDGHNGNGFTVKIDGEWVSWSEDGTTKKMENLVFVNPDEYPIFGTDCLNENDRQERYDCSNKAMLMSLYKKIKYPPHARNNGIQGTVVLRFLINSDGSTSDFEILKDLGGGCGEEALRVAKLLKVYRPPMMEGKPVAMKFALPVKYRLH